MSIPDVGSALIVSYPFKGTFSMGILRLSGTLTEEEARARIDEWDVEQNLEGNIEDATLFGLFRVIEEHQGQRHEAWNAIFRFTGGKMFPHKEAATLSD